MRKFKLLLTGILLCFSFTVFAQQTLKGVVKDKTTGEGLPGVTVVVKGTNNGTSTDFDGNFELKNVKSGDTIVVTYLGFKEQEVTIGTNFNITIQLEESTERLDEIVVVGYGSTTVKDATGSVEAITAKDFTKGNIVTPENLLSGRVSGVSVKTSGAPGSGSEIRIRGGSSLGASNNPLIVIDGLPINEGSVTGSRGILASINPNDIESFSVLKDASATAIYGSRAANGVIIITTKKGSSSYSLDYDLQFNFGKLNDRVDVFSAGAFRDLIAQRRPGDLGLLGSASTDWQDQIFQTSVSTIHNLSVRGALFDKIPTRLSVGFTDIEGSILTSNFNRANVSLSMNPSFFDDHLKIGLNYNRAFEDSRFGDSGQIGSALRYDPTQPVYDATNPYGGFYQHMSGAIIANGTRNPVAELLLRNNTGKVFRQYGNLKFDYKFHFLPELSAVVNLGIDKTKGSTIDLNDYDLGRPSAALINAGVDSRGSQERKNELIDAYLKYGKEFGDFKFDVTAGYSYQRFENFGSFTGNIFAPNNVASSFADPDVVNIGYLGRVNVSYKDKYLLTLNYRRDGTSRFSEKNRWGDFGGASFAWQMSEEDFLKDSNVISTLKLRASYGLTGQQNLPGVNDLYLQRYRFGNQNSQYLFGNQVILSTIPSEINEDLKWEETATIEVGIDYGLFDDKITGSLNVFKKNSTDLLADSPTAYNFTNSVFQNNGEFVTRGIEFSASADVIATEDINWNVNFNATFLDREIEKLALGQDVQIFNISGGTGGYAVLRREGEAPDSFYVFKQLYDTAGNPIEGAYADLDGNGIINDDDRYIKENPQANVILGLQSSFNYKKFDLAFNLRANIGNYVYNNVNSSRAQYALLQDNAVAGNIPTSVLNTNFINTSDVITSDIYIENASFLRMDNITLGYTFDRPIKKYSTNSVRIWAGMQNVFTITNYSGLDPEVFNGIDNLIYPRARTILLGVNVKF
ncbi:SusC/RagA family TonB-linked outer membrane protein [Flavobacteriaceae bacterium S356]|uniref:SusC/RagA family TonB-linked outer membrane protein n=1 Tax=Asprobacillus argus TaxID=3076534 RepID=A0ABU3LDE0_9FLAO|nr:SusC/RagA family TonB-linked outer membrane protein [Flavobacteriaceae bacterium S356]